MRRIIRAGILFCMAAVVFGTVNATGTPYYAGDLTLSLEEQEESGGSTVKGTIEAINLDAVPIANSHVVLHIQRGCEQPTYPSQFSNCDTIFAEKILHNINVPAERSRTVSFNYTLPTNARSGTYRVDAYWEKDRASIVGVPYIFSSPESTSFTVTGEGRFPSAQILRTDTQFKGVEEIHGQWQPNTTNFAQTEWPWIAGPVGVLVTENMDTISGRVAINATSASSQTLTIRTRICRWNDITCDFLDTREKQVTMGANGRKTVPVSVKAPEVPGAYAIRIELLKDDQLLSLYRNRAIVKGPLAKIRKITVDRPFYSANSEGTVKVVVGTSPDHYTNPTMEDIQLHTSIVDTDSKTEVFSGKRTIEELSTDSLLMSKTFNFTPESALRKFRINAKTVAADGSVFDQYNYTVNALAFAGPVANMTIEGSYDTAKDIASLHICGYDRQGLLTDTAAQLLVTQNAGDSVAIDTRKQITGCNTFSFSSLAPEAYTVTLNNENGEQFRETITFQSQGTKDRVNKRQPQAGNSPTTLFIVGSIVLIVAIGGAVLLSRRDR